MEQFKGSMDAPKPKEEQEKKVITPIKANVVVKKQSRLKGLFRILFSKDIFSAMKDAIFDVTVPNLKDNMAKTGKNVIDQMFYDTPSKGNGYRTIDYGTSYNNYNRISSQRSGAITTVSSASSSSLAKRNAFEVTDFIFKDDPATGESAIIQVKKIIDQLQDICRRYGNVTVLDFCEVACIPSNNYLNDRYGWTNLEGLNYSRMHDGYIINFPRVQVLETK